MPREKSSNEKISYRALQRLAERAWDEQNMQQLMRISRAVDSATTRMIQEETRCASQVVWPPERQIMD